MRARALAAAGLAGAAWLLLTAAALAAAPDGDPAAAPPDPARMAEEQLRQLDTEPIRRFVEELQRQTGGRLPRLRLEDFLALLRGEGLPYGPRELLSALAGALLSGVRENLLLLGWLVTLAVVLALLRGLQNTFEGETVARTAYLVVYLAAVAVGLVAFQQAVRTATGAVDALSRFMQVLLPVLIVLLAGVGAVASAGLLQPLLLFLIQFVGLVVSRGVVPAVFLATVLDVVHHLPGPVRLTRLAELLRQVAVLVMSACFVAFLGAVAVQGAAGAVADGVALRTAKFALGTLVPVLGKMFADAAELVVSSSLLVKNAVGLFGAVTLCLVAAWPLVKLTAMVLTFRLAAALVQPLGDEGLAGALAATAGGLSLITVAAGVVALMFFLTVTAVVAAGNAAVALR